MPNQSRVTDLAMIPADAHVCPACPHVCIGPGILGSPNILVNGLSPLRVGDMGVHAACCGANMWVCAMGSTTVTFNDIAPSRVGDVTAHCGGVGALIMGSTNVITGG
jgi:uncharacterized Zn-binding protein involved in type VI secretion